VSEPNRNRKKQDPAWLALKRCVLALEACPPEMVRANLEFLWDKYVRNPKRIVA
jgi:hypothetical protein